MRCAFALLYWFAFGAIAAQVQGPGHSITCSSIDTAFGAYLPAPANVVAGTAEQSAEFIFNFTDSVPAEAEASIRFAGEIWGSYLQSDVPIRVEVGWQDQGDDQILASAGPGTLYRNFPGAVDTGVWYPVALTEAILGVELTDTSLADIFVVANSTANWNFSLDGSVPRNRIDLTTVMLHELGHGLGFLSSVDSTTDTTVSIGFEDRFIIYDLFLETPPGRSLVNTAEFPSPSEQLLAAVIDRLTFVGDSAVAANGGEEVPLFAPQAFDVGSSVSHLDERTYRPGRPDALMTPSIASGEAVHAPGPVTLGVLFDLGWPLQFTQVSTFQPVLAGRLAIYPNPARGVVTVEIPPGSAPHAAVLYGADGRQLRRQPVRAADGRVTVDIDGLTPGMYTVLLQDEDRAYSGRLVVR